MTWTPASLMAFEMNIAEHFNRGEIKAPIHLSGGNEKQLINYFSKHFNLGDWVGSTWRSHYHALLAGVPPEQIKTAILAGKSITLCFPEYNFFSSAIVGGHLPIALGIALGIKRARLNNKVHCFVGDMAARTGICHEVTSYTYNNNLPLNIIVEDNGLSVCTDTIEAWGSPIKNIHPLLNEFLYYYKLTWPHSGAGKRINF